MLRNKVQDAINQQINAELASGCLYLSIAAYGEVENLPGFGHWMRLQNQEEVGHAMKLFDFVNDRGGSVTLQAIGQPPTEFQSPLDII